MSANQTEATSKDTFRYVELARQRKARYVATNRRGGTVEIGEGDDGTFTPTELLLTALAACTAMDVDYIVGKRAEAESGWLRSSAHKVRDEGGNHLVDIELAVDLRYPEGEAGDAARDVLPMALQRSNDRLCTVGRTIQIATPVKVSLVERSEPSGG
jgi:putative redox protein